MIEPKIKQILKDEYKFLGELEELKSVKQIRERIDKRQRVILDILGL